nr:hypothetical protein [uncultured Flavobacterium sp.]
MKKIKLLALLFLPFLSLSQQQQKGKSFTEKLEGISTSQKELTKNASTDNSSIPLDNILHHRMRINITLVKREQRVWVQEVICK